MLDSVKEAPTFLLASGNFSALQGLSCDSRKFCEYPFQSAPWQTLIAESYRSILDEATANIDLESDDKLQKIVRSEFKGTTITVAHRLNTM